MLLLPLLLLLPHLLLALLRHPHNRAPPTPHTWRQVYSNIKYHQVSTNMSAEVTCKLCLQSQLGLLLAEELLWRILGWFLLTFYNLISFNGFYWIDSHKARNRSELLSHLQPYPVIYWQYHTHFSAMASVWTNLLHYWVTFVATRCLAAVHTPPSCTTNNCNNHRSQSQCWFVISNQLKHMPFFNEIL